MSIVTRLFLVGAVTLLLNAQAFAADYHIVLEGSQQGPFSVETLAQYVADGKMTKDTKVWTSGMSGWASAGEQAGLKGIFDSTTPPLVTNVPPPIPQTSASGDEVVSQADVHEMNSMSDPKNAANASDDMDDWFDSVLQQFGIKKIGEHEGRFVFTASQSVALKATDPQYGDALVNALDKAMMKLQEQYLMARFGKTTTEKAKSFYSDRSTNARDIELPAPVDPGFIDKTLAVLDKSLDVAEKKLDQELIELGVSPDKLAKLSPKKKKNVYRDKFLKNTIRKASGSIAGLFPIQTNVISDNSGRTVVGIVALATPKTIQIAKDISMQRKSLISGKGKKVEDLLPATNEEFLGTLGVRLMYDQDGSPAIVSYGISSYRPDDDDAYINDELKSEAKADAVSSADAQIAEIINGRMNAKSERTRGEEVRKYVEREMRPDSDTVEKTIKNIIKITNAESKSSARAKLQGISTVKNWRFTTKEGHKFVGSVRMWRYGTLQAVSSFNNPKSKKRSNKSQEKSFSTFQRSSKPVNTMDDF